MGYQPGAENFIYSKNNAAQVDHVNNATVVTANGIRGIISIELTGAVANAEALSPITFNNTSIQTDSHITFSTISAHLAIEPSSYDVAAGACKLRIVNSAPEVASGQVLKYAYFVAN